MLCAFVRDNTDESVPPCMAKCQLNWELDCQYLLSLYSILSMNVVPAESFRLNNAELGLEIRH